MLQVSNGEKQADKKRNGHETSGGRGKESLAEPKRPPCSNQALLRMDRSVGLPSPPPLRPSRAVVLQRKCSACKEEEEKNLQRKVSQAKESGVVLADGNVEAMIEQKRGGGFALDGVTREQMEATFHADFRGVRIHHNTDSDILNRKMSARAFTTGQDIFFSQGAYSPDNLAGRELIAHELTHVVQQSGIYPIRAKLTVSKPGDALEQEADSMAKYVVQTEKQQVPSTDSIFAGAQREPNYGESGNVSTQLLQRQEADENSGTQVIESSQAAATPLTGGSESNNKCGPDITSSIGGVLGSIASFFHPLPRFQKRRSCMVLDSDFILSGVNPIMAWDTRELFLPNTGPLIDPYFRSSGCGSPRSPGCDSDATRNRCETEGTCGNTVVVGGKCMLAGTANYAAYGKMFKLCNDEFLFDYTRGDMRAMITLYKTIALDSPAPPKEMASSVFDGTFPSLPAVTENRGNCPGRCGITHAGSFDFVWEPYHSR